LTTLSTTIKTIARLPHFSIEYAQMQLYQFGLYLMDMILLGSNLVQAKWEVILCALRLKILHHSQLLAA